MPPGSGTEGTVPHPETQHVHCAGPRFPLHVTLRPGSAHPAAAPPLPHLPQLPCLVPTSHARTQSLTRAPGKRGGPRWGDDGHCVGSQSMKQPDRPPWRQHAVPAVLRERSTKNRVHFSGVVAGCHRFWEAWLAAECHVSPAPCTGHLLCAGR